MREIRYFTGTPRTVDFRAWEPTDPSSRILAIKREQIQTASTGTDQPRGRAKAERNVIK